MVRLVRSRIYLLATCFDFGITIRDKQIRKNRRVLFEFF